MGIVPVSGFLCVALVRQRCLWKSSPRDFCVRMQESSGALGRGGEGVGAILQSSCGGASMAVSQSRKARLQQVEKAANTAGVQGWCKQQSPIYPRHHFSDIQEVSCHFLKKYKGLRHGHKRPYTVFMSILFIENRIYKTKCPE